MTLTTAAPAIELLMDRSNAIQEIEARITARAFQAVHHPEQGPELREVLAGLLALLDASSPNGFF
jgi:hypothetical protein